MPVFPADIETAYLAFKSAHPDDPRLAVRKKSSCRSRSPLFQWALTLKVDVMAAVQDPIIQPMSTRDEGTYVTDIVHGWLLITVSGASRCHPGSTLLLISVQI